MKVVNKELEEKVVEVYKYLKNEEVSIESKYKKFYDYMFEEVEEDEILFDEILEDYKDSEIEDLVDVLEDDLLEVSSKLDKFIEDNKDESKSLVDLIEDCFIN